MKKEREFKAQEVFKEHIEKGNCGGCKQIGNTRYLCGLKAYHGEGCDKWIKLP